MPQRAKSEVCLRRADFNDIEFLWYLRCQPDVYRYFRTPEPTAFEGHLKWVIPILLDFTNKELFVIECKKKPVGQVRFDYEKDQAEVSISLLKEHWGSGLGAKSLGLATEQIKRQGKVKRLLAEIHKDNSSSIRLFEKLGFKLKTKKDIWLDYVLEL